MTCLAWDAKSRITRTHHCNRNALHANHTTRIVGELDHGTSQHRGGTSLVALGLATGAVPSHCISRSWSACFTPRVVNTQGVPLIKPIQKSSQTKPFLFCFFGIYQPSFKLPPFARALAISSYLSTAAIILANVSTASNTPDTRDHNRSPGNV